MGEFFELRVTGIEGAFDTLNRLPAEVVSKRGGPVKLALRAGARVILKAARQNLRASIAAGGDESTGLVAKSLVATRGKAPIGTNGERYLVRVKRATYQATKGGEKVTTLKTAQLMEYGSSHQNPQPWLRPAGTSNAQKAVDTISRELLVEIDKVVKKLAAQNKGR